MYVCLIITVKRLDQAVPNFAHRSTLAQRYFFLKDLFRYFFGLWTGVGGEGRGKGKGGEGRGKDGAERGC